MNKIVLWLLSLFGVFNSALAQSFFKDSTYFYSTITYGHEGPDVWPIDVKTETIFKDSAFGDTTFYIYTSSWRDTLVIKELRNRVYLNGSYRLMERFDVGNDYKQVDDTIVLKDYLIYDFNLLPGDTFWIADPFGYGYASWSYDLDSFVVLSDTGTVSLENGEKCSFQSYEGSGFRSEINTGYRLLGSSIGPLGFFTAFRNLKPTRFSIHSSVKAVCGDREVLTQTGNNAWPDRHFETEICNKDSIQLALKNILGTEEVESSNIHLWPNPCTSILNIKSLEEFEFLIMNKLGKEVLKGSSLGEISTSSLTSGVYFLQIRNQSSQLSTKFLKL